MGVFPYAIALPFKGRVGARHSRHAASPPWPLLSKNLGSGREAMPLNFNDWHGDIPRPPALFSTAGAKADDRLLISPGHANPPPEAPVPPHQTTVMIGVPVGSDCHGLWQSGGMRGEE